MSWFKKKPAEPKPLPKRYRVSVHLKNGQTVIHYAAFRTLRDNGGLGLHNRSDGNGTVADYAAGEWSSVSVGKRSVSVPVIKLRSSK
jgi:hypothetical protein